MKRKKLALYNPYLDVLGGGEKHLLSIAKIYDDLGYEVCIFWDDMKIGEKIEERFNIKFYNLKILPNIFTHKRLANFFNLLGYDTLLTISDGSYFFHPVKHHYLLAMIPLPLLYPHTFLDKLKTKYTTFLSNSKFTANVLADNHIKTKVVYPYIDIDFFSHNKKDCTILSVGRFFKQPYAKNTLHDKKHEEIINAFIRLKSYSKKFEKYSLILAGGAKDEDLKYVNSLKEIIKNRNDIILHTNPTYETLKDYYKRSKFYFHFTGYGINEKLHPEQVEHFGITPLEAMASACITCCYNAGGPKEYINDMKNGILFTTIDELINKLSSIENETTLINEAQKTAETFNYDHFYKRALTILSL